MKPGFLILFLFYFCSSVAYSLAQAQQSADQSAAVKSEAEPTTAISVADPSIDTNALILKLLPLSRDKMAVEAAGWFSLLQSKTQEIVDAKLTQRTAQGKAQKQIQDKILALGDQRKALVERYGVVIDGWENKGGDADKINEHRAYVKAILSGELQATDFRTLFNHAMDWLGSRDGGVGVLFKIITVVVSFIVLLSVAGIVRRFVRIRLEKLPNISSLLRTFLVRVLYWLTLVAGILMVLALLGVNVTPLFAVVGGASFIVAFALQETLGNLASGLLIMITKPFDVGDYVNAAGVSGVVEDTSIVATTIKTFDNQMIVVPNNKIWGSIITNINAMPTRRVDLVFGIGYDDDIEAALNILEEETSNHPLILAEPKPLIRVHELADSSVNFICWPWAKTSDYWAVYWDLTRRIKERFDAAGISIPYPQQDIHLHGLPSDNSNSDNKS